jgi:hypothetical protein
MLEAVGRFAPSETVREKVREAEEKYHRLLGQPTEMQEMQSKGFCELVARRVEELKNPPSDEPVDPELRKVYYDPEAGPIPMIKRGRGPGEPAPYKVFDDPEPAPASAASTVC